MIRPDRKYAYNIKYALSSGKISAVPVENLSQDKSNPQYWTGKWHSGDYFASPQKESRDFSFDEAEARQMLDSARERKITSLQRQIDNLKAKEFVINYLP